MADRDLSGPVVPKREKYSHGYSLAATVFMSWRSVEVEAAFFLKHLSPGMRVLDAGCGPGTITLGLAKVATLGEVTGIDLSENQINRARERALAAGIKNVRFEVGSLYDLPFADNSLDAVFTHTVLEHLAKPHDALKEIVRVLRPGGIAGARHSYITSSVFSPKSPFPVEWVDRAIGAVARNGGNLDFGATQGHLMRQAGLDQIVTTSSTAHVDSAKWQSLVRIDDLRDVIKGWGASDKEADALVAGLSEWSKDPDAFWISTLVESVGRKPETKPPSRRRTAS